MHPSDEPHSNINPYSWGANAKELTEFLCSIYSKTLSHTFEQISFHIITFLSNPHDASKLPNLG
jgi:hypothetical protein